MEERDDLAGDRTESGLTEAGSAEPGLTEVGLTDGGLTEFTCPRCGVPAAARYWGPCPSCREELAATMRREARNVDVADYEPKMNVVPNQVATKD